MGCQVCASSTDFQPSVAAEMCFPCPFQGVASPDHAACLCSAGTYAISFSLDNGNLLVLKQLDPIAHGEYLAYTAVRNQTSAAQHAMSAHDAYNRTGFWCAKCPTGADCTQPGTSMETVQALPGYFAGTDKTNTYFSTCFNDACSGNGACASGYTGMRALCKHKFFSSLLL